MDFATLVMGSELDALVAEKVMGWKDRIIVCRWKDRPARKHSIIAFKDDGKDSVGDYSAYVNEAGEKIYCGRPHQLFFPPHYSVLMEAAWEVVEHLVGKGMEFSLQTNSHMKDWRAEFENPDVEVVALSAPLAICLAALKAVEE